MIQNHSLSAAVTQVAEAQKEIAERDSQTTQPGIDTPSSEAETYN